MPRTIIQISWLDGSVLLTVHLIIVQFATAFNENYGI